MHQIYEQDLCELQTKELKIITMKNKFGIKDEANAMP